MKVIPLETKTKIFQELMGHLRLQEWTRRLIISMDTKPIMRTLNMSITPYIYTSSNKSKKVIRNTNKTTMIIMNAIMII